MKNNALDQTDASFLFIVAALMLAKEERLPIGLHIKDRNGYGGRMNGSSVV